MRYLQQFYTKPLVLYTEIHFMYLESLYIIILGQHDYSFYTVWMVVCQMVAMCRSPQPPQGTDLSPRPPTLSRMPALFAAPTPVLKTPHPTTLQVSHAREPPSLTPSPTLEPRLWPLPQLGLQTQHTLHNLNHRLTLGDSKVTPQFSIRVGAGRNLLVVGRASRRSISSLMEEVSSRSAE